MAFWRRYIVLRDKWEAARGYVRLNMVGNAIEVYATAPLKQDKYTLLLFGRGFNQRMEMKARGRFAVAEGRVLLPRSERILAAVMGAGRMALLGESDGALSQWGDIEAEALNRVRRRKPDRQQAVLKPVPQQSNNRLGIVIEHAASTDTAPAKMSGATAEGTRIKAPTMRDIADKKDVYSSKTHDAGQGGEIAAAGEQPASIAKERDIPDIPLRISMEAEPSTKPPESKPKRWDWRNDEDSHKEPSRQMQQSEQLADKHDQSKNESRTPVENNGRQKHADKEQTRRAGITDQVRHVSTIDIYQKEHTDMGHEEDASKPENAVQEREEHADVTEHTRPEHEEHADRLENARPEHEEHSNHVGYVRMEREEHADSAEHARPEHVEHIKRVENAGTEHAPGMLNRRTEQGGATGTASIAGTIPLPGSMGAEPPLLQGKYAGEWQWDTVSLPGSGYTYLLGRVENGGETVAVAVAVAGEYAPSPPPNLNGFNGYAGGYWVLAQDARTGEQLSIG